MQRLIAAALVLAPVGVGRAQAAAKLASRKSRCLEAISTPYAPAGFMTNPAGAAVVNALGPIRQLVRDLAPAERRWLVVAPGLPEQLGAAMRISSAAG